MDMRRVLSICTLFSPLCIIFRIKMKRAKKKKIKLKKNLKKERG